MLKTVTAIGRIFLMLIFAGGNWHVSDVRRVLLNEIEYEWVPWLSGTRSQPSTQQGLQAAQTMRCANGRPYFNYHEPLSPNALTLTSLFDGRGKVLPVSQADTLRFDFGPLSDRADPIGDNRTQALPRGGAYYAVVELATPTQ